MMEVGDWVRLVSNDTGIDGGETPFKLESLVIVVDREPPEYDGVLIYKVEGLTESGIVNRFWVRKEQLKEL